MLPQPEDLALSLLYLLLALLKTVQVVVELCLQVLYLALQLALGKAEELVGLSEVVDALLLLLIEDTVLL